MEYNKTHRREQRDPMLSDITEASSKVLVEWLNHPNPDVVLRAKHELRIREGNGEMIMHDSYSSEVLNERIDKIVHKAIERIEE